MPEAPPPLEVGEGIRRVGADDTLLGLEKGAMALAPISAAALEGLPTGLWDDDLQTKGVTSLTRWSESPVDALGMYNLSPWHIPESLDCVSERPQAQSLLFLRVDGSLRDVSRRSRRIEPPPPSPGS